MVELIASTTWGLALILGLVLGVCLATALFVVAMLAYAKWRDR